MENEQLIRDKILHILKVYPVISPTMLQISLGPSFKAAEWRAVLETLIEEGIVIQDQSTEKTPSGRHNTHRRIYLARAQEVVNNVLDTVQEV